MSSNMIPNLRAAGKYVANAPFDIVVDQNIFFTAEAIRTIPEMQALKNFDLFEKIYAPAGYTAETYQTQVMADIADNAAIIALTSRGRAPVYVPSTFLKSFPLVDGVIYEHLALVTDLGACPPSMKDKLNNAIDHINNYVKACIGIKEPNTRLGVIPTRGYVSREQATLWENSRQLQITEEPSDAVRLAEALKQNSELRTYIQELEAALKAK